MYDTINALLQLLRKLITAETTQHFVWLKRHPDDLDDQLQLLVLEGRQSGHRSSAVCIESKSGDRSPEFRPVSIGLKLHRPVTRTFDFHLQH